MGRVFEFTLCGGVLTMGCGVPPWEREMEELFVLQDGLLLGGSDVNRGGGGGISESGNLNIIVIS